MAVITRLQQGEAVAYLERVLEGDTTPPSLGARAAFSNPMDRAAAAAYREVLGLFRQTAEYQEGMAEFLHSRRTCGGFRHDTAILRGFSPFEQMVLICDGLRREPVPYKTICLETQEGEVIPGCINSRRRGFGATPMQLMVGWGRNVPKYREWELTDPHDLHQEKFEEPLRALEMARQPDFLGALLFKANAAEAEQIDHAWEYRVGAGNDALEASVELKEQQSTPVMNIKRQAAGSNLVRCWSEGLEEADLLPHPEDEERAPLTAERLSRSLLADFQSVDSHQTEELMQQMLAMQIRDARSAAVREWSETVLVEEMD